MIFVEDKTDLYITRSLVGKRYPRIAVVRVSTKRGSRCATVKVTRCANIAGGAFVRRVYHIYSKRVLARWLRAAEKLYGEEK